MVVEDVIILNFAQDNIFFGTGNSAGGGIVVSLTCTASFYWAFIEAEIVGGTPTMASVLL